MVALVKVILTALIREIVVFHGNQVMKNQKISEFGDHGN